MANILTVESKKFKKPILKIDQRGTVFVHGKRKFSNKELKFSLLEFLDILKKHKEVGFFKGFEATGSSK